MYQENVNYNGEIIGAYMTESRDGRPGLIYTIDAPTGRLEGSIWFPCPTIDGGTKFKEMWERAKKNLEALGFEGAILNSEDFWQDPGAYLATTKVNYQVKMETYKGNVKPRAKGVRKIRVVSENMKCTVAAMRFGDPAPPTKPQPDEPDESYFGDSGTEG